VYDLFWLYRPTAPSVRAQSIQVVNAAWSMAARGHRVTLAVQAPRGRSVSEADLLAFYGLEPHSGLALHVLPWRATFATVAFRMHFLRWLSRSDGRGVVIARSKRSAREALRVAGGRFRLILEAHEVDSVQAQEAGSASAGLHDLEAAVLAGARGVVCNAPGTLDVMREAHPNLPPAVALHNGTLASRARTPSVRAEGIGYVGSIRAYKGLETLAEAARRLREPVTVVGPDRSSDLASLSDGWMRFEDAIPHRAVPDRLAQFRILALPLGRGLFGEQLTSPLKLWDYLASGVPLVAADTSALRSAAPGAYEGYLPGDVAGLAEALRRVRDDQALRDRLLAAATLRTWSDRAAELEQFLDTVLA
jgi:glycosyltransferase involved in cell wall biosynthesis